jgi:hypothetical protein
MKSEIESKDTINFKIDLELDYKYVISINGDGT